MPHDPYKSLYIHIPFCKSRCNYCDFHTNAVPQSSKWIEEYSEFVVSEIRRFSKEGELAQIESVYIGGGTPTHIGTKYLSSILYAIGLSMHLTDHLEFTVEGNPESIDERLIADIWALGANRLSIGVQSFDDGLLKTLGRAHNSQDAENAIKAAQTRFENISIDLMCGLPGQTLEQFDQSIDKALRLGVKHISIYPLTIESGTKFEEMLLAERLHILDEDTQADMLELAADRLSAAGLVRYEVANYAYPGFESVHNSSYWRSRPYIGIGHSAVTMTQNSLRRMRVQDGMVVDDLDQVQMAAEDLMLAMRMSTGISAEYAADKAHLLPKLNETLDGLEKDGLIVSANGAYMPTDRGWLLGNELYGRLLDLAD